MTDQFLMNEKFAETQHHLISISSGKAPQSKTVVGAPMPQNEN